MDPKDASTPTPAPTPEPKKGPEEYIRTLEGDINIVQRGGTPGLAPLKPAQKPAERLIEASPIASEQPGVEEKVEVPPAPVAEAPKPPAPAGPVPLETYANDFQQHVTETKASKLSVLAAEQDAGPHMEGQAEAESPEHDTKGIWYIAGGVLLLLFGVVGAYLAYARYLTNVTPVATAPSVVAPIFVDGTMTVSGTGKALLNSVAQAAATPIPIGTVRELVRTNATSSMPIFLDLGIPVPGILVRNITGNGSFAGIAHTSTGQNAFFILPVDFYSATFSGMLAWEPTMQRDLQALYPLIAAPVTASSTATSTAAAATTTVAVLAQPGFKDEVVSNHDVRVYRDVAGHAILIYGYWNQNTLIIARDPAAFTEAVNRLATSHTQ